MAIGPISNQTLGLDPATFHTTPLTNQTPAGELPRGFAQGSGDVQTMLKLLVPLLRELSSLLGNGFPPGNGKAGGESQPARSEFNAASAAVAGAPGARGWLDVYNDRLQRMQEAQDPALKAHYHAELEVMRKTLDQMGVSPPSGANAQQSVSASSQDPGTAVLMPGKLTAPRAREFLAGADNAAAGSLGRLPPALAQYSSEYESASRITGVPTNLLAAMNWQESRGDTHAPGGGLGQMTNERFTDLQTRHPDLAGRNLSDPATNILATAFFMKDLTQQFGGNPRLALRAYNSGENGVDRNDPNATPAGTGDPTYVKKVMNMAGTIASGGDLPP